MKKQLPIPIILSVLIVVFISLFLVRAEREMPVPTFAANNLQSSSCAGDVHDLSQAGTPTCFVCFFGLLEETDTPIPTVTPKAVSAQAGTDAGWQVPWRFGGEAKRVYLPIMNNGGASNGDANE